MTDVELYSIQSPEISLAAEPHGLDQPAALGEQRQEAVEYGWRYVAELGPDGQIRHVQAPLTRDDVIHPQEGDHILNGNPHAIVAVYLYQVFKSWLKNRAVVFHDVRIDWDIPGLRHHSPDVSIIPGARQKEEWSSFDVAVEKIRPELLVEVTSPSTWEIDLEDKIEHYARARVRFYLIVEMEHKSGFVPIALRYHELTPDGYRPLQPDSRGWHWLETVELWVGMDGQRVSCFQEDRTPIGSYEEVWTQFQSERRARVAAERKAARNEKARQAAERERQAAERERQAAEQRAAEAERELQRLRAELDRLRGG